MKNNIEIDYKLMTYTGSYLSKNFEDFEISDLIQYVNDMRTYPAWLEENKGEKGIEVLDFYDFCDTLKFILETLDRK